MAASEPDYKKLYINAYGKDLYFISYLTDSDISYEMKDQQLPFVPTSFNNDSMATRVMEKAKFTFDVFSKHRDECIQNYNNLQTLLSIIKPSYWIDKGQYVPAPENVTGFFRLKFPGMPLLDRDEITLHLTSFNYTINKDTGYLEVDKYNLSSSSSGKKLIPISYKISIEGKILLPFNDTVRMTGAPAQPPIQNNGGSSAGASKGAGGASPSSPSSQPSTGGANNGSTKSDKDRQKDRAEERKRRERQQRAKQAIINDPRTPPEQKIVTQAALQEFINTTSKGMFEIDPDQSKASVHIQEDINVGLSQLRNALANNGIFTQNSDGSWRYTNKFDASNSSDLASVVRLKQWATRYGVKIKIN